MGVAGVAAMLRLVKKSAGLYTRPMKKAFDFHAAPGHVLRRVHQLANALYTDETAEFDTTNVQFATLHALIRQPGQDQVSLAKDVALDAATLGSVLGRLERKGLVRREVACADKRCNLVWITEAGEQLAQAMKPAVQRAQQRMLAPLSVVEQALMMALLHKLSETLSADMAAARPAKTAAKEKAGVPLAHLRG